MIALFASRYCYRLCAAAANPPWSKTKASYTDELRTVIQECPGMKDRNIRRKPFPSFATNASWYEVNTNELGFVLIVVLA